jgi:hypothetical protein
MSSELTLQRETNVISARYIIDEKTLCPTMYHTVKKCSAETSVKNVKFLADVIKKKPLGLPNVYLNKKKCVNRKLGIMWDI